MSSSSTPNDPQVLQEQLARSEAQLRASQELFMKAFHGSPALMTIAALPEGRFVEVNNSFLKASGFRREQVIGRTTLEIGVWADPSARNRFLETLGRDKVVRDFEAAFRVPEGFRTLLLNADLIVIDGRPCILTVSVDISERKRREMAEAALAAAEARYRSVFENAVEGLYVSSIDGRFLSVNPALARLCGYATPDEMMSQINNIGRQFYADPARREQFMSLVKNSDEVPDFESEIVRKDGTKRWVSESVRAVRDASGEITLFEGIAIDVTAQREAARALQAAKDTADAASRAKSQFLAAASHELRTPLNGILGYTQILNRDSELSGKQREAVGIIHESAEHLLVVINDVLDLSRVEAGRLELHPSDFDLRELITGIERVFVPRARQKSLLFESAVAPSLPETVNGDPHRLRQVLYNLVGNAVKFTRQGGIVLSAQPGTAGFYRFSVSDTGPGINEQDLARLFQPFTQLSNSGTDAGSGLGLAISRSLVELLGGKLQVESRPGWGSRFWFEIPLGRAESTAVRPSANLRAIGYAGKRRRVLVVDDNETNRSLLLELLSAVGFEVAEADNGEIALARAAEFTPDIVMMDIRMPVMDGLEATRQLRARAASGTRGAIILAVSASVHDVDREECFRAGCDGFLAKPFREDELWEKLGHHLGVEWLWESASAPHAPAKESSASQPASPPPEELAAMLEHASRGDIVALRDRARGLAERDARYQPFAKALLELAAKFKMKAIREFLNRYRAPHDGQR